MCLFHSSVCVCDELWAPRSSRILSTQLLEKQQPSTSHDIKARAVWKRSVELDKILPPDSFSEGPDFCPLLQRL